MPPVTIMFAPTGSVDKIYTSVTSSSGLIMYNQAQVTSPIYLLVGRRDEVVDPVDTAGTNASNNFNDFTSLWVAINANTGLVIVTDMAATGMGAPPTAAQYFPTASQPSGSVLWQSRNFARQSDAMGGK